MEMRRAAARSGEWAQHLSNASCFFMYCETLTSTSRLAGSYFLFQRTFLRAQPLQVGYLALDSVTMHMHKHLTRCCVPMIYAVQQRQKTRSSAYAEIARHASRRLLQPKCKTPHFPYLTNRPQ